MLLGGLLYSNYVLKTLFTQRYTPGAAFTLPLSFTIRGGITLLHLLCCLSKQRQKATLLFWMTHNRVLKIKVAVMFDWDDWQTVLRACFKISQNAQHSAVGHFCKSRVEGWNIHLHHCLSLSDCQSYAGCWDFDFGSQDGELELSGSDRCDAAAFSWSAAGSAGVKSGDCSTKSGRRVENEEGKNE